ncbi:MAG TPA: DUF4249 domain-containing protein, partial [Mucilaginibacter sp.]|nr:DUF4249 domain-containing protein [Mucilaginibacter sp.]
PIDTLRYEITGDGVNFYTSAHDASNSTRYYRWDYTETYIFVSQLDSYFEFNNSASPYVSKKVVLRQPDELIHTCYVTDTSNNVILGSSANLAQDIVNNTPITHVSSTSEKFYHRYSINLRQYALTRDAYQFWSTLKKNTEELGNIFDAQPSQLNSNIHCITNPNEPVIGYLSVSTVSQKRVFIDNSQLPAWPLPAPTCMPYTISWSLGEGVPPYLSAFIAIPLGTISAGYDKDVKDSVYIVRVGDYDCVDCRYHFGGKTKKPDYWIDP